MTFLNVFDQVVNFNHPKFSNTENNGFFVKCTCMLVLLDFECVLVCICALHACCELKSL